MRSSSTRTTVEDCSDRVPILSGCLAYGGPEITSPITITAPVDVWPTLRIETWRQPYASLSNYTGERVTGLIMSRLDAHRNDLMSSGGPAKSAHFPVIVRLIFEDYQPYGALTGFDPFMGDRLRIAASLDFLDTRTGVALSTQFVVRSLPIDRFIFSSQNRGRHGHSIYPWQHRYDSFSQSISRMRLLERAFASAIVRQILTTQSELYRIKPLFEPDS